MATANDHAQRFKLLDRDMARCGDRYLVFSWLSMEYEPDEIWRANSDGSNPTQLTKEFSIISRRARRMELGFTMMNRKGRTR